MERRNAEEAEQRAHMVPRTIPKSQPAATFLESKLEQFEDGELLVETMKGVATKEEAAKQTRLKLRVVELEEKAAGLQRALTQVLKCHNNTE